MNEDLMAKFRDEIRKALPSITADELLAALAEGMFAKAKAEALSREVDTLKASLKAANDKLIAHSELETKRKTIEDREVDVKVAEEQLRLKEGLINLREKHAEQRVQEMRGVLSEVFANSRLKYSLSRTVPMLNKYGNLEHHTGSEAGEKEV